MGHTIDFAFVRHGESTGNIGSRVLGHELTPNLTDVGRKQARKAAAKLTDWHGDALWTSDMVRARCTAEAIAGATGLPIKTSRLLREQNHGVLDGMPVSLLSEQPVPAGKDITEIRWGGGESIVDVYARLRLFMGVIAAKKARRIIVVGHNDMGCVFDSMLAYGNFPEKHYAGLCHRHMRWIRLHHGEIRLLRWNRQPFAM